MGGRLLEGPTMAGRTLHWKEELERFLRPFLARLGHKARRRMCPLYVSGLIGPGDRKSIQPMAERVAFGDYDQLHHFIAAGVWDAGPVETELLVQADKLVGGSDAVLVIDDTVWPTPNGAPSVGAPARKESSRLVLLLFACGLPTDHRSGLGTKVSNICRGSRLGSLLPFA
jgi:hypothetical protein